MRFGLQSALSNWDMIETNETGTPTIDLSARGKP